MRDGGGTDSSDGGGSSRESAVGTFHHHVAGGGEVKISAYVMRYRLDLFSNFTFFANDPVNGDQIEQTDRRTVAGSDARYHLRRFWRGASFDTTAGVRLRADDMV